MTGRAFGHRIGRAALALALGVGLAGCEDGAKPFGFLNKSPATTDAEGTGAAAPEGGTVALVERDVEAPEVFDLTDEGLWDGRPSLGGVWVAHATVRDPERVIIRNTANDKYVIGALFRRERDNPGPSIQVSSDAAEALGMLAGQPAGLKVVALRREEAPEGIPAEAAPGDEVLAAGAEAAGGEAAAAPAAGGIEQTKLDPIAQTAAAALDKAEGKAPEPAATATAAPAPAGNGAEQLGAALPKTTGGATTSEGTTLNRAYVQIGIFSVEANAGRAVAQMKGAGMTATVKKDASQGKTFWRVIVGPAATVAERDALAGRVKALGYPDAYPVAR